MYNQSLIYNVHSYNLPYVPMAVQELDDSHVGRLSFHCKEDVIRVS